jgi:adenine phosphoribosyltransferase
VGYLAYVNGAVSRCSFVTVTTVNYLTKYCTIFRDLFSVLGNPSAFRALQDVMIEYVSQLTSRPEAVVALEARGFLFGTPIALHFDIPFIPIRKNGKLPGEVIHTSFTLEYGTVSFSRDILFPPHSH